MKAKLHIQGPYESRVVEVENEVTLGRTDLADVAIDDTGLSRVNTTFFVDDGELWVADENSTNGTFLNGDKIEGRPRIVRDGDRVTLGSGTTISVEISEDKRRVPEPKPATERAAAAPAVQAASSSGQASSHASPQSAAAGGSEGPPIVVIASAIMTVLILLFGGVAYFVVSQMDSDDPKRRGGGLPVTASALIPVRVIDPLGGEDEDDLDDLIASWEVAEEELKAGDVADMTGTTSEEADIDLNVSASFLAERQRLAFEPRPGEAGVRPAGLIVPKELYGDGVIKQKAKLREMNNAGYRQPMDFADLAEKRLGRELIEMPMATESFYLDVGGSAQNTEFMSFRFSSPQDERLPIVPGHPKYETLKRLADNFAGQQYDLNNADHRKQMRRRLLRMFHPQAKPILRELADAYFGRFRRPLRVTSLTRSMDYQIILNQGNANSFKVRGEGSLPPHTSGCAFDLARKHMPVEEQNFVMAKLAEMERDQKLDALIEYGANACFHVFIYSDRKPPARLAFYQTEFETFPFLAGAFSDEH